MISITRPNKPTILIQKEQEWTATYVTACQNYKKETDKTHKKAFKATRDKVVKNYKHAEIYASLRKMHSPVYSTNKKLKTVKCAYCEGHITDTGQPHIEHFRPKEKYPSLCFEWTNLLIACACCNVNYKGSKFPIHQIVTINNAPPKETCLDDVIDLKQQACYINPAEENPNVFFLFEYDPALERALIRPKNGNLRAARMIDDLGLNERAGLLDRRTETVEDILELVADLQEEKLSDEGITRKKERLKKHLHPSAAFSAFAHAIVQQFQLDL
ncbi:MAG: retron system putative HNH endonuclease [Aureispira sp.]